jgi:NADH:ubiquinone reductase (H+-translocating)
MKSPIIIVGGGFGGVYTAKHLLKAGLPVLLISEHNYFTFTPLLHEVAGGNLTSKDVLFEYSDFFDNKQFRFVRGTVDNIDFKGHHVHVGKSSFSFQYLVIATGSSTNFYSMKGTEHCHTLKTIEDALRIKRHLLELAQGTSHKVFVNVIGGGPTGIELILELKSFLDEIKKLNPDMNCHLRLINAGDTLLRPFPQSIQEYAKKTLEKNDIELVQNAIAKELTPTKIKTTAGDFDTNLTILAAGVTPRTSCATQTKLDDRSHVCVDENLQVKGYQNIFALGDVVVMNEKPVPKLAQVATQQAKVVAENIIRLHSKNKNLVAYEVKLKGMLVSLGTHNGAGSIFGITIKGFIAWWLWRTVYLFKTPGLTNKLRVAFSWTIALFSGKDLVER